MLETQVQSLGREDTLEKGMATHSSIFAWRIPWTDHGVKKQQLKPNKEQRTGSKLEKKYKVVQGHPTYLTYMQSTSLGWINHKTGIKIAGRNINNLKYAGNIT